MRARRYYIPRRNAGGLWWVCDRQDPDEQMNEPFELRKDARARAQELNTNEDEKKMVGPDEYLPKLRKKDFQ